MYRRWTSLSCRFNFSAMVVKGSLPCRRRVMICAVWIERCGMGCFPGFWMVLLFDADHISEVIDRFLYFEANGGLIGAIMLCDDVVIQSLFEVQVEHGLPGG